MNALPVVLDSAGLSELATTGPSGPKEALRTLLREAWRTGREVLVPAVVCAEVCRGTPRTRAVESLLARSDAGGSSALTVVPTNFELAKRVGLILDASGAATEDIVDAHVVAVLWQHGGGIAVTSDPDDILRLASPFTGLRVVVRSPVV